MKKAPPFVSNTKDGLHCMQAAYLTILKYFQPDINMSMSKWSKLTGFKAKKGTWESTSLVWFKEHGYDVKHYGLFDFADFIKNGGDYLISLTGEDVGSWQIEHSDIPYEQKQAKKMIELNLVERREPTREDIKNFIDNGHLVRALVNSRALANKKGYFGHAITVYDYDNETVTFHDPGPPPLRARKVNWEDFEKAWASPNRESKELDAIKL